MNEKVERVVFVRSNPVNPDSRVEKEVYALLKDDYKVTILGWDRYSSQMSKGTLKLRDDYKTSIIRFGYKASFGEGLKNIIPFIRFQIRLFGWLLKNRNEYDIIHACDFDTAFTSMITTFITRKKMIFDIFDYLSTSPSGCFGNILKFFEDAIINHADATIICTEQRVNQIKGTNPKKLTIIHNSPIKVETSFKQLNGKIKIAYVGILQDYRLLKEIANVVISRDDCELHIGGFGKYENYFKTLSHKYDNIFYYGKISYDKTIELESQCDVMTAIYDPTIGNHYYAAPNKFYESLMLGKPVIMVKNTGMSHVVSENDFGILIDFNEESFNHGLDILFSHKDKWKSMNTNMKKFYDLNYSWDKMEKRLLKLYQNI